MGTSLPVEPDIKKEQHFFTDEKLLQEIVRAASLTKKDVVLEIGAGTGILTRELVKYARKVVAVEIDLRLRPLLQLLPKNAEVIMDDALAVLPRRKDFNKIVANIPYQICEPLLQYLCSAKQVELSVLTVPLKFARRAQKHPLFAAFLMVEIIQEVPKEAFSPPPKVRSAIVRITPNTADNDEQFILRKLHWQRTKKLRNGLRDTLIDFYERKMKKLSKKEALELIKKMRYSTQKAG